MPAARAELAFALGRPFAEQVAFFRGKLGRLVPTATWRDLMREQHDRAFMVAGAAKADLLADLAAAVERAIAEGEGIEAFRRRFGEIVQRHGWQGWRGSDSKAGTAWRTRVIYRTNMATSYAAGRLAQLKDFPLWVYRHSGAEHPRLQHQAWDGLTLPADHPFWKSNYPPNGWNCFPAGTMVRCDALLGQRAWYDGEMVQLDTRLGHRLTVTANHPVLTGRGWVVANELQEGDELIGAAGDIDAALHGIVDHEQAPARVEDLFEALAAHGLRVVPVAPDDFHGDALGMKGEIHIAGGDGCLMHVVEAAHRELAGECGLDGALHGLVRPADVAGGAAQVSFVHAEAAPPQDVLDGRFGDAKPQGDRPATVEAGSVETDNGPLKRVVAGVGGSPGLGEKPIAPSIGGLDRHPGHPAGLRPTAQHDAGVSQRPRDSATAAAMLMRQLLDANAGLVALDHVVEIRKFDWSGHVYDFTTSTSLIMAGGVVVSNCGCRVVGASSPRAAERLGGKPDYDAPPAGWDARDAKGRLPGVDEGWDYQPGATAVETAPHLAAKLDGLPAPLSRELLRDLAHPTSAPAAEPPVVDKGRVAVEIVRSTARAHLVKSADGREAWIQARWLKNGSVAADTFDRQAAEMASRARDLATRKEWKNALHNIGAPVRETEKAVAIEARWHEPNTDQSGKRLVWFPKSQIKDGAAPGWLIELKARELRDSITRQPATFKIELAGREFWL